MRAALVALAIIMAPSIAADHRDPSYQLIAEVHEYLRDPARLDDDQVDALVDRLYTEREQGRLSQELFHALLDRIHEAALTTPR